MNKIIILCVVVFSQCQPHRRFKEEDLLGTWKTDSIYNYTNGFGYWTAIPDSREEVMYEYDKAGHLFQKKADEKRCLRYSWVKNDSLVYLDTAGKWVGGYKILQLSPIKLVLKKHHQPPFPGKNQEVFEIRVFSPLLPSALSEENRTP